MSHDVRVTGAAEREGRNATATAASWRFCPGLRWRRYRWLLWPHMRLQSGIMPLKLPGKPGGHRRGLSRPSSCFRQFCSTLCAICSNCVGTWHGGSLRIKPPACHQVENRFG